MKQVKGWWLPDTDTDFDRWILDGNYQKEHRDGILSFLKKQGCEFNKCLDIGDHVGLWSVDMANHFKELICFEPVKLNKECLIKNLTDRNIKNYTLYDCALGGRDGKINSLLRVAEKYDSIRQSFKGIAKDLEDEQSFRARGGQELGYDQM